MYTIAGITVLTAIVFGSVLSAFSIRRSVFLRSLCQARTREKVCALTFDDGPHPERTARVLDVLGEYGAPAAFFLVGCKAEQCPDAVRRIVAEGHLIGNHTYRHKWSFPLRSSNVMAAELSRTKEALRRITGLKTALFRPPFGVTNPPLAAAVRSGRYVSVGWSVRSLDTWGRSRDRTVRRVTRRLRPGAVILLHDRCADSDLLLRDILDKLKELNYKIVRLDELFGIEAYED